MTFNSSFGIPRFGDVCRVTKDANEEDNYLIKYLSVGKIPWCSGK